MLGTGLVFHHFSIMSGNGVGRTLAASVFVSFGIVQAVSNLAAGWLLDRVPPRFLLAIAQMAMAGALVMATFVTGGGLLIVYGVILGVMQGMSGAITLTVYPHYFGRAHLGAIKGIVTIIGVAGTAAGPLIFSLGLDFSGSYRSVLMLSALAPLAIAVVTPWLRLITPTGVR